MSFDVALLHPVITDVARSITPDSPAAACPVANAIYWALRVDTEVANGGIAQLLWNLHDSYDAPVITDALVTVGAADAAEFVRSAFAYVDADPSRRERRDATRHALPDDALIELTDRYASLNPSVATMVGRYAIAEWDTPSFRSLVDAAGLTDPRTGGVSADAIRVAIEEADGEALLGYVAAGLDPDHRVDGESLIERVLSSTDAADARISIVERLVAAGADVNSLHPTGSTPLITTTLLGGLADYTSNLIELGAVVAHVDGRGCTALFGAVKRIESVRVLLDAGADVAHTAHDGRRPLGAAREAFASWGHVAEPSAERLRAATEVIELLIDRGAPLSEQPVLPAQATCAHTELGWLVTHPDVLAIALEAPGFAASPDVVDHGAWTAMHEASRLGIVESIRLLADAGAPIDAELATSHLGHGACSGTTPFDVAADDATQAAIASLGGTAGTRRSFDVFVTARGERTEELVSLIAATADIDAAGAVVDALPPEDGMTVEFVDGALRMYRSFRLAAVPDATAAEELRATVESLGAAAVVV